VSRVPLLVALCLLFAGCGSVPPTDGETTGGPEDSAVDLSLTNGDDEPYAVSVSVTQGSLDGVSVTYENGSTRTFEVGDVSGLPPAALDDAVAVAPQGPAVRTERYDLSPGAGIGDTFRVPGASTLVYVVSNPSDGVRSWGKLTCGASASHSSVSITIAPDGSLAVSNACS
jgi:hypothetical protein